MISTVLTEILANPDRRSAFLADRRAFLKQYADLSSDEIQALLDLDSAYLEPQALLLIQ